MMTRAPRTDFTPRQFAAAIRQYQLLSPGAANGFYCLGGLLLSGVSWRSGWLKGWLGATGFLMWTVGLGLTIATLLEYRVGMVVSGALVMGLFIPWAGMLGWRLRPP